MQTIEYGPNGVFGRPKYGKYQHRFKVDMRGNLLWPLCYAPVSHVLWWGHEQSDYTPMCPACERRHRAVGWLPMGESRWSS